MEPKVENLKVIEFTALDSGIGQFVLNSELFEKFRNDKPSDEMQPISIITFLGGSDQSRHRIIKTLFEDINMPESASPNSIQLWNSPIDVKDISGTPSKAYVVSCHCEDDEDIKNGMMAMCMLFSSSIVITTEDDILSDAKTELPKIASLVESLQSNGCFETDDDLSDQLPSLIYVSN